MRTTATGFSILERLRRVDVLDRACLPRSVAMASFLITDQHIPAANGQRRRWPLVPILDAIWTCSRTNLLMKSTPA